MRKFPNSMVAEILQKSKFLLYVLYSCYMKFCLCYMFIVYLKYVYMYIHAS